MNIIKLLTFSGLVTLLLFSCDDAYDIQQRGELDEETAFQSIEDIESGLIGVYGSYNPDGGGNGNGNSVYFNAIFTDNLKAGIDNNGQGLQIYQFLLQPSSNPAATIYGGRYATINFANRILRAIDNLELEELEDPDEQADRQDQLDNIQGQLLAIRALCHFELLQYYSTDPSDPSALGVAIFDFVPEVGVNYLRESNENVYAFVNEDLTMAQQLLEDNPGNFDDIFFITELAVKAIQSEVALYQGEYASAIDLADDILSQVPLASRDDYIDTFTDNGDAEEIFTLSRGQDEGQVAGLFYFNAVGATGGAYLEVSNELEQLLDADDVRRDVIIFNESNIVGPNDEDNLILIGKYPGSGDGALINDYKVYRSGEIQLIKAEAQARLGNLDDAENTMEELRDIRFDNDQDSPDYSDLTEALIDILEERRLELAFEAQRYLDLKRIGQEVNVDIERNAADCASFSAPCALDTGDYRFTLPIPQTELNANRDITQNPEY